MNAIVAAIISIVMGAIGGIGYAYYAYGGVVKPQAIKRDIPLGSAAGATTVRMVMWVPGAMGHTVFGAITGLVVFGTYTAPSVAVTWGTTMSFAWYHVVIALLAGLGGSGAVGGLIDQKQWKRIAPVLQKLPSTNQPSVEAPRAFQALQDIGAPVTES
ncbi:MAG TPA: hypothetical protein VK502_02875 [Candidatus Saccharimonadales bacterium]|nr:hypothetical protein [Candidatus Saccharimonadales bacterium]